MKNVSSANRVFRSCWGLGGFTLVEMMVVVAIIAIITTIAIPSYLENLRKGRRGEAISGLLTGAQALERYYTANGRYLNGGALAAVFPTQVPENGPVYYNIAAQAAAADSFTLRATRTGVMADDDCGDFEITQSGARSLVNNTLSVEQCWRR